MELADRFEQCRDEFLRFVAIPQPPCPRADLCAFLLLNELVPGEEDILGAAEHDQVYLNIDCDRLNEVATDEDIMNLTRCGVFYDTDGDCLSLFV